MTGRAPDRPASPRSASSTVYATWQREPEHAPGAVAVIDASKLGRHRVRDKDDGQRRPNAWQHGRRSGRLAAHRHNRSPRRSRTQGRPEAPPSRRPTASAPPRDLPGADNAKHLYEQFAPLTSLRAFGVLDAAKLKELGLDNPSAQIDVTVKGAVRHYKIGQPDAGRGRVVPARHPRRARLPDAAQRAQRAAERAAPGRAGCMLRADGLRLIKLASGGKEKSSCRSGVSRRRHSASRPPRRPTRRDQTAKNWHDASLAPVPDRDSRQGRGAGGRQVTSLLRVDYTERGKGVGWIRSAGRQTSSGILRTMWDRRALRPQRAHGELGEDPSGGQIRPRRAEADRGAVARATSHWSVATFAFARRTSCATIEQ